MADDVSIEYKFDVRKAHEAVIQLTKAFTALDGKQNDVVSNAAKSAKGLDKSAPKSKGGESGSSGMLKNIALGNLAAQGITKGMSYLTGALPMVTQMFSQIGNIISNNIFRPLQRYLVPILMDVLRWVRENRTKFLQLGTVIVSIFKAGFAIVGAIIKVLKTTVTSFFDSFLGKGKMTFDKFVQFLNLMLLKLVFIITFIGILIEPVIKRIGNLFSWLMTDAIMPFMKEFSKGMVETFLGLAPLVASVGDLLETIFGKSGQGEISTTAKLFGFIGKTLNQMIFPPLRLIFATLTFVLDLVNGISLAFQKNTKSVEVIKAAVMKFGNVLFQIFTGSKLTNGFSLMVEKWKRSLNEFISIAKSMIDSVVGWFEGIGQSIMEGIRSGITGAKALINDSWLGKAYNAVTGKKVFGGDEPKPLTTSGGTSGGGGASSSYTEGNQQVEIKIDGSKSPMETAKAVKKVLEQNSARKRFNKAAASQGIQ